MKFLGFYPKHGEKLSCGLPKIASNGLVSGHRVICQQKKKKDDSFKVQNRRSQTECSGPTSAQADVQSVLLKF